MKLYTISLLLEHDFEKGINMFKYIPKKNDS